MKLQLFNGGLNTRLAPQLLKQNQGAIYTNIDPTKGTLVAEKDKEITSISTSQYAKYFDAEDRWVDAIVPTTFLEFQGRLYSTDGVKPKKYYGNNEQFLGITQPNSPVVLQASNSIETVEDLTVINGSLGNLPQSDLSYMLVNYDSTLDLYSAPYFFTAFGNSERVSGEKGEIDFVIPPTSNTIGTSLITRNITVSNITGNINSRVELYRYYKSIWYKVGEAVDDTVVINDNSYDISANDVFPETFIAFDGVYQYVYTYYNSTDGTESAPSPVSEEVSASGESIVVSNIAASSDPQVTDIRLYRVGGNVTQFSLVAELVNSNQTYVDRKKDSEIVGNLLESENYSAAPDELLYISESYAMLFGAVGTTLRFTPIGVPNAWPPEYSIEFDNIIVGIGKVANGLLVMTAAETFIVTGTGPLTLSQQSLRGDQGCIAHASVQPYTEGSVIWASRDGLCASSGNNVVNLTKGYLDDLNLDPVDSAVVNEVYYCLNSDDSILVWDYRFERIPRLLEPGVKSVTAVEGALYGWANGRQCILFKDTGNLTLKYMSPRYTEGSLTLAKVYKKFYFQSKGDIIIDIIINDVTIASKALKSGLTEFQVPSDKQRGRYVQFYVEGTGELEEIEYLIGETRNG